MKIQEGYLKKKKESANKVRGKTILIKVSTFNDKAFLLLEFHNRCIGYINI